MHLGGSWSSGRPRTWDGVGSPPSLFGACGVASDTEDRPRGLRHNADNHGDHPGDRIGLRPEPTADNGRGTISRNRTPGLRWAQGCPKGRPRRHTRHHPIKRGMRTPTTVLVITRPKGQGPSHRIGCRDSAAIRDSSQSPQGRSAQGMARSDCDQSRQPMRLTLDATRPLASPPHSGRE